MEAKSVHGVLEKARQLLATAEIGYSMAAGTNPVLRPMGIHNVAVFGRSVSIAIQNLRSVVAREEFDEWYAPRQKLMADDPVCRFFRDLRNEILKEGPPPLGTALHISYFDTAMLPPAPPGAGDFFMGDQFGGCGWEVDQPDGTTAKFYVQLPPQVATVTQHLPNSPDGRSITDLCCNYVDTLRSLVDEAEAHFDRSS